MPEFADFEVIDYGSVVTFEPLTLNAKDFAKEAFSDALTWGEAYVAERAYCLPILADLVNEQGFIVRLNGHIVDAIEETR